MTTARTAPPWPASRALVTVLLGQRSVIRRGLRFLVYLIRRCLFPILERVIPADDRLWCFCTWDTYAHTLDNPRAVFEAVRHDKNITCVVLQKAPSAEFRDEPRVRFIPAESLRGIYYLARSRVVVLGYALRGLCSVGAWVTGKHFVVQLLHGVTIRRVGLLFPRETWWPRETPKYSLMIASSERERDFLAQAFHPVPRERIWVTGLPRNDILLGAEADLPPDYREHLAELRGLLKGRRLVLYAPTWRDREDGHYRFSSGEANQLAELLQHHHAVLGIHGHPNVRNKGWYRVEDPPNEILHLGHFPDVTLILRETQVLITDYSSIFIDFLLTGRPILHFAYDYDAYLATRIGFLYQPHEYFSGPVSKDFRELTGHLREALTSGVTDPAQYARARDMFHEHEPHPARAVADIIRAQLRVGRPDRRSAVLVGTH